MCFSVYWKFSQLFFFWKVMWDSSNFQKTLIQKCNNTSSKGCLLCFHWITSCVSSAHSHPRAAWYLQCSRFSVPFIGGCPLLMGSVPGLLWEPLPRVALLDAVVPLQDAICCRSSVDTVTMHSSEGSEAAAAHELCMREPTLCRGFMTGVWAAEWVVDEGVLAKDANETSWERLTSLS